MHLRFIYVTYSLFLLISNLHSSSYPERHFNTTYPLISAKSTVTSTPGNLEFLLVSKPTQTPAVKITASSLVGKEGDKTEIILTITTDYAVKGDQSVEITYSGHEITPEDIHISSNKIVIHDGQKEARLTLSVVDDHNFEGSEKVTIAIINPSSGLKLGDQTSVEITLSDNEYCPTFDQEPENVTIINGKCDTLCRPEGGKIMAPAGKPCPEGSSIQFYDGSTWSYKLPVYYQNGVEQGISTRCVCNSDTTYVSSESKQVYTSPQTCDPLVCYKDHDKDGYGNPQKSKSFCGKCAEGFVENKVDCDDNNNQVYANNIIMPSHASNFYDYARGYLFKCPVSINIKSLLIPTDAGKGSQNIAILKFNSSVPSYPAYSNDFKVLFLTQNNQSQSEIMADVEIKAGDVIGILGQRDNVVSYSGEKAYLTIGNEQVPLSRIGMQFPLNSTAPKHIWMVPDDVNIGRILFSYCINP